MNSVGTREALSKAEHSPSGLMSSTPPVLRYIPSTRGRDEGMNHSGDGQCVCVCVQQGKKCHG